MRGCHCRNRVRQQPESRCRARSEEIKSLEIFFLAHGSRQGQNLALTGLVVPNLSTSEEIIMTGHGANAGSSSAQERRTLGLSWELKEPKGPNRHQRSKEDRGSPAASTGSLHPSECDHIAFWGVFDVNWRSPKFGDVWYKSRHFIKTICSSSEVLMCTWVAGSDA